MPIIKRNKTKNYSVISNTIFRDPTISMKAKGLFAYLMTLPEDWSIHQNEVVNHFPDGKASISKAFQELKDKGYMIATDARNTKGQLLGIDYTLYEEPQPKADNQTPKPDYRESENPKSDNRTLLNTNNNNLSILNTNKTKEPIEIGNKSPKFTDVQQANINNFRHAVGGSERGVQWTGKTWMAVSQTIKNLPIANIDPISIRKIGDLHAKATGRICFTDPWDWVNIIKTMLVAGSGVKYMNTLNAALNDNFFKTQVSPKAFLARYTDMLQLTINHEKKSELPDLK